MLCRVVIQSNWMIDGTGCDIDLKNSSHIKESSM